MKVSGKVYVHLELKAFEISKERWDRIREEVGDVSPARMLSELIFRELSDVNRWEVTQVSAIPERWEE